MGREDPYFRFMSLWVAFNALCYALYHRSANRKRADLQKFQREPPKDLYRDAQVTWRADKVDIKAEALEIRLSISEKYTEENIFSQFVKEMQSSYRSALADDVGFDKSVDKFREAIKKPNGFYVLNFSKENPPNLENWSEAEVKEGGSWLSSFHDKQKLSLLKGALYRVRCNVFHGEKVPGDVNDDRIVRAAAPVLEKLLFLSMPGELQECATGQSVV